MKNGNGLASGLLSDLNACEEALEWVGERDPGTAWSQSPRGDWLLWYAGQMAVDRRQLVRTACACARLVLPLVREGEERPRLAIEAAERWADDPTEANRRAAGTASCSARAAWAAAWAAGAAGYAAAWAAWAAGAADAAWAAARAADAADAAGDDMHRQCADAVRAVIPFPGVPQTAGVNS